MVLEMLTFFGVWQTQPWRSSHFFFKEPVRACLRIVFCFLYKLFHRMASPNAVVVNDQSGHWWWVGGACLGPIICPYNTDKDQNVSQGWNHTCIDCVRVLVRVRYKVICIESQPIISKHRFPSLSFSSDRTTSSYISCPELSIGKQSIVC